MKALVLWKSECDDCPTNIQTRDFTDKLVFLHWPEWIKPDPRDSNTMKTLN